MYLLQMLYNYNYKTDEKKKLPTGSKQRNPEATVRCFGIRLVMQIVMTLQVLVNRID